LPISTLAGHTIPGDLRLARVDLGVQGELLADLIAEWASTDRT
jgi:hypothetical protein